MLVRMWGKRNLHTLLVECKLVQPLRKTVWRLLKILKIDFSIWSSNTTPRDIPKGIWLRLLQRHLHTHVYCSTIHNSQAIAKLWKQPRCPTTNEWINKMWYLYTMEFYSATNKNEILSFSGKWMELKNIILSEVSQAQKAKNHTFSLICGL
jgi:hypothetical protein